jgi:hypothetical protein
MNTEHINEGLCTGCYREFLIGVLEPFIAVVIHKQHVEFCRGCSKEFLAVLSTFGLSE